MTRPVRCCLLSFLSKGRSRCVVFADLRYNRANETAAEGYDGMAVAFRRRQ